MAKAHRAPMDTYVPKLAVAPHAILRFRERAERFLQEGGFLSDRAVANYLDTQVWGVLETEGGEVYDVEDEGQPTKLVHIEQEQWGSLWAVVRENRDRDRRPDAPRWALITLLTDWMLTNNSLEGRYIGNVPRVKQFEKQFEKPVERPKREPFKPAVIVRGPPGMKPAPPPAASAAGTPPPPSAPPVSPLPPGPGAAAAAQPVPAPAPRAAPDSPPNEPRLLAYEGPSGPVYEQWTKEQISARVEQLLESGVSRETIKVWRPVPVRMRVDVE